MVANCSSVTVYFSAPMLWNESVVKFNLFSLIKFHLSKYVLHKTEGDAVVLCVMYAVEIYSDSMQP